MRSQAQFCETMADVHSGSSISAHPNEVRFTPDSDRTADIRKATLSAVVSRASPVQTAMRNCTRDEGGPFEAGSQVLVSSHRKLLSSKAMVVSVAETLGRDPGRQD